MRGMSNTTNLVLPYLAVGQAQKHVTVNESLRRLDALVQLSVISAATSAQPVSPADGAVYIVPAGKSGDHWSAYANESLAYYRDGAWEQVAPREGWIAYVKDADQILCFDGAGWQGLSSALTLSATDRILGRLSPDAGPAEEIAFTAQARALCDDPSFPAMCATLGTWRVLAAQAVAQSHTGDTTETPLAAFTLPGGAMGPNGLLRITSIFTLTNSANAKTLRYRLGGGGITGSQLMAVSQTTSASIMTQRLIHNRNDASEQVAGPAGFANSFGGSANAAATASVDTSTDQTVAITGQLASSGDTITLESCLVEVAHGA
jgi:hypothetical protein